VITSEELAFVRLAMRRRLLSANKVREAVERKRLDAKDRSIPSILIDMGALQGEDATKLKRELRRVTQKAAPKPRARLKSTIAGRDPNVAADVPAADPDEQSRRDLGIPDVVGNYRLTRLLGAGAMGAVYVAEHQELRRTVALKLLMSEGAPSPRAVARFKREARLAARLDHPNIVRVYEAGVESGHHYIAMDMVKGRSVAELIALGELSPRRAVHIVRQVAEAVGYAHAQGVIHRDLKPANVLVDQRTGDARVTDFGLATLSEPDEDDKLTRTGAAVGTPAYMAPEQVRGQLHRVDGRTDVYALGATLYEMLVGKPPFEAGTFLELAKMICDKDAVSPRRLIHAVPDDVETICLKALEKDPKDRYQQAYDMAADLAAFLDDEEIVAQPPSTFTLARRTARRHPVGVAVLVGALGAASGLLGWKLTRPGHLHVSTTPPGAVVYVDDAEQGTTPRVGALELELPAGEHDIRFALDDYLETAGSGKVRLGRDEVLRRDYVLTPDSGNVLIEPQHTGGAKGRILEVALRPLDVAREDAAEIVQAGSRIVLAVPNGRWQVAVTRVDPGLLLPDPVEVTVQPGETKPVPFTLHADPSRLVVTADPEDVRVHDMASGRSYPAPAELSGAGRRTVRVTKPGYLPRRLEVEVPPGGDVAARVTLAPLAAWRRPLPGRLYPHDDGPGHRRSRSLLTADVDGDGALDVLALEQGPAGSGRRLVLLPGGGRTGLAFPPAATRATTLVAAHDVNDDGFLDVFLGAEADPRAEGERRGLDGGLEVRDGRTGRLVPRGRFPDLSAYAVTVHEPAEGPPVLLFAGAGDRPRALPVDAARPAGPAMPAPGPRRGPVVLRDRGGLSDQPRAVHPVEDGLLVQDLRPGGAVTRFPLEGVTPTSVLRPVYVERASDRGGHPWILVVPERGRALLVEPLDEAGRPEVHPLGDPTSAFRDPAVVLGRQTWILLGEGRRSRVFAASSAGAVEARPLPASRPFEVGPGLVWTAAGRAFRFDAEGWEPVPARSAEADAWIDREGEIRPADLDGDGLTELLAASPDGRSLVSLAPDPDRLRWRARFAEAPTHLARAALRPGRPGRPDLLVVQRGELFGYSGADGRVIGRLPDPPGEVVAVAAEVPREPGARSAIYMAYRDGAGARLARYAWRETSWELSWKIERAVTGLEPLPFDADGDGANDLLVGGPMTLVRAVDGGEESWPSPGPPPGPDETPPPRYVGGSVPIFLAARVTSPPGTSVAVPSYLARDPRGTVLWEVTHPRPGGEDGRGLPQALLSHDDLPFVVAVTDEPALVAFQRTDGVERWVVEASDDGAGEHLPSRVVGGALAAGTAPRLALTDARGSLRVFDAGDGAPVWSRPLPGAAAEPTASAPTLLPAAEGREAAIAVVAPSGVLCYYALSDGAWLGEVRPPGGERFDPRIVDLGVEGPLLGLTTRGRRLHVVPPRPGQRSDARRVRLRELTRRIRQGEPYVGPALEELAALAAEDPTDVRAQVALAQGHLVQGDAEAALAAAEAALRRDARSLPALVASARATYAVRGSFDELERHIEGLARDAPDLAGRIALELGEAGGEDGTRFLRMAVELAPQDPEVRRVLGLQRIKALPELVSWNAATPSDLDEIRRRVSGASESLLFSLTREPDAEALALAILSVLLERRITEALLQEAEGDLRRLERQRWTHVRQVQELLGARLHGPEGEVVAREPEHARLLELARELPDARGPELKATLAALRDRRPDLEPGWSPFLEGIYALRPRE